jgi:beta-glucanase (GH16 family)
MHRGHRVARHLASAIAAAGAVLVLASTGASAEPWTLAWSDEFNGSAGAPVDGAKWVNDVGGTGWGNQELEYYTSGSRNVAQDGAGHLVITASKETLPKRYRCWYGTCQYSSGRIKTLGRFEQQYGRFEAAITVPRGQGLWPAFWMLGYDYGRGNWPASGEIDVMENIGREPTVVHGTIHGPGYSEPRSSHRHLSRMQVTCSRSSGGRV